MSTKFRTSTETKYFVPKSALCGGEARNAGVNTASRPLYRRFSRGIFAQNAFSGGGFISSPGNYFGPKATYSNLQRLRLLLRG